MKYLKAYGMYLLFVLPALGLLAPVRADEAPDLSGSQLYQTFCASCHGAAAQGDGPVAPYMKITVPDLTRIATRYGGKFPSTEVHDWIDGQKLRAGHGSREMPVWGWEFYAVNGEDGARRRRADELINRLVEYLRSIQRN